MQPNLFTVLNIVAIVTGAVTGAKFGFGVFGFTGGAIGGVLGMTLGYSVACGFDRLTDFLLERRIEKRSTPVLRAKLAEDYIPGTFVSSLIISVLLERGEPPGSFRDYIFRQLHSEDVTWRRAGLSNLALCYPDLAAKLDGFDPFHPTLQDLEKLKEIEATGAG